MAYLGLDPSTTSTGWAVISKQGELVGYGVVAPGKEMDDIDKLILQKGTIDTTVKAYGITHAMCEDQFMRNNAKTLKQLVEVRTAVMMACTDNEVRLTILMPSAWRKITHGTGKATKPMTRKWVNETFDKEFLAKENDITDAIGIAYACYMANN